MTNRLRYALIGTGSRAQMYLDAIAGPHADRAELVAIGDTNPGRVEWSLAQHPALGAPLRFEPGDLADIVPTHQIDRVIVTTPDLTHADYIVTARRASGTSPMQSNAPVEASASRSTTAIHPATARCAA
jgi:predicted dehydrogenase